MNIFKIIVAIVLFSYLISVNSADYYVDQSRGNDGNSGLQGDPWKSIDHVNQETFWPGDNIFFKRGEIWRGQLNVTWSGTEYNPISFSNYGSHLANPLIKRTAPPAWWQYSLVDGGFETFIGNTVDTITPNFKSWGEHRNHDLGAFVTADENNTYLGKYAVKLERTINSGGATPVIKTGRLPLLSGTDYYVRFFAKTEKYLDNSSDVLTVRIIDDRSDSTSKLWWNPTTRAWTTQVTNTITASAAEFKEFNFTFTPDFDSGLIEIRFEILNGGNGAAWIDEVILVAGNTEPDKKIWAGMFPDIGKIYGMIDDGARVNTITGVTPELLFDQEFLPGTGGRFYFRNDQGVPVNSEVGYYMNAIRVHGQHDIIIDGIDAQGPGVRYVDLTSDREAGGAIFITPGSYNITVKNLSTSLSSSIGLEAGINSAYPGIFWDVKNPYGILYENINSHSNGSTGIYLRGSGIIRNSKSYNNGLLLFDQVDKGGIGLQQGPTTVEQNEIFNVANNGDGSYSGDSGIHICCPVVGQFIVRRNYIHDLANGGITLHNNPLIESESHNFGHIIEYNVISRYGNVTENTSSVGTIGKDAAIKIRHLSGTTIRNNVISFGGNAHRAVGIALLDVVHDTSIYNNVFLNNTKPDFHIAGNADHAGLFCNNNIHFRPDYAGAWQYRNDFYNSIDEWQTATQQDFQSLAADPMFISPLEGDFHPHVESPAIDAGINQGQTEDYEGHLINTIPDIGAFEHHDGDSDGDGIFDSIDNCRKLENPGQLDHDQDDIGDICDDDADNDGYTNLLDCDDLDFSVYPGALEISYDQIDQDCDGSDATIVVTKATYNTKGNKLIIIATSELGQFADLVVEEYGAMVWKKRNGYWQFKQRIRGNIPETVIITGREGSIQALVK